MSRGFALPWISNVASFDWMYVRILFEMIVGEYCCFYPPPHKSEGGGWGVAFTFFSFFSPSLPLFVRHVSSTDCCSFYCLSSVSFY